MKVANTNAVATSLIKDSDTQRSKQAKASTRQGEQSGTLESTKEIPNSSKLGKESAKNLATTIKNANTTIGSLEVMIRSIHSLQTQNKAYQKLALKIQDLQGSTETQSKAVQDLTNKADGLKEQMQKTFDTAMFGDENVFTKSYADIPESNLNAKKLSPNTLDVKQPENLKRYAKDLSEQRSYAKQAKRLVQSALDERLDSVQKTDSSYAKLDSSKLNAQEFKAAQGSSGVTLDRVLHLLR